MTNAHPSESGADLADERWQVDPDVVDTEDDADRKQVLGVVQELTLPATDLDVAQVVTDLDLEAVRSALTALRGHRLDVAERDGRLTVTAVLHPQD